jgi:hypothetical protein
MPPVTPYTADLEDRDPIAAIRETTDRIADLAGKQTAAWFERTYAPGKWTARQVLTHLAQTEIGLGSRARMALATPNYTAQSFDQDQWMAIETRASGPEALAAFVAVSRMNRVLFESLSAAERATAFAHPEYGPLTVDWVIHQMAGHQIHHLKQLERIGELRS